MRWLCVCLLGVVLAIAGCESTESPRGQCQHVFWHKPVTMAAHVEVIGDFNGWRRPGLRMTAGAADGYVSAAIDVVPGEQRYVFVEDGTRLLDRAVGTTAFEAGEEVSLIDVRDCGRPVLRVAEVTQGSGRAEARLVLDSGEIDPAQIEADGLPVSASGNELRVTWEGAGKRRALVRVRDRRGNLAECLVTLWSEPFDLRDALVYQIIVDRYRGSEGWLTAPASPSGRAGGTLRGVLAAIDDGELEGASAIWLNPLNANPEGEFAGSGDKTYSSYHGYWPISARALDPRLGTEDDLRALVAAAHARGIRVVLDVVPNHVHEQHPYASTPGWTGTGCVCGSASCDWAPFAETCWFAPYLPDLDWRNDAVARQVTDDIADWVQRFDLDGVRIDAVPMMPRAATRRITAELRRRFDHPGAKFWVIGENYTGPDGFESLRYYLGPSGLDTEFHFPLMWTLRGAVARGDEPMSAIEDTFVTGEATWSGSGAVMGLMIGNHDVARFASVSTGEADGDGWSPANDATDPAVFDKQLLALGLVMTLPGAPFIYYGDEVALVGRPDPDSRRIMPAPEARSSDALRVRAAVRRLAKVRACSTALRRGDVRFQFADRERLIFSRGEGEGAVLVVATRNAFGVDGLEIPIEALPEGNWVDVLSGETIALRPALTFLPGGPLSLHVYVREGDPCGRR